MAHTSSLPEAALNTIADQIAERLPAAMPQLMEAAVSPRLAESFPIVMLPQEALAKGSGEIADLVQDSGYWHHQISSADGAGHYATSRAEPASGPAGFQVKEVVASDLATAIETTIGWIDANVGGDPLVRMLIAPAYYLTGFWLHEPAHDQVVIAKRPDSLQSLAVNRVYESSEFLSRLAESGAGLGLPTSDAPPGSETPPQLER